MTRRSKPGAFLIRDINRKTFDVARARATLEGHSLSAILRDFVADYAGRPRTTETTPRPWTPRDDALEDVGAIVHLTADTVDLGSPGNPVHAGAALCGAGRGTRTEQLQPVIARLEHVTCRNCQRIAKNRGAK